MLQQDLNLLRSVSIRERVNFSNSWRGQHSHKTFLPSYHRDPSLHAQEKLETVELCHKPWCVAQHSWICSQISFFSLQKGHTSIIVHGALHWDITEHYQWGCNRSLYCIRKIQQFELMDASSVPNIPTAIRDQNISPCNCSRHLICSSGWTYH